jgi:hypothetical protein
VLAANCFGCLANNTSVIWTSKQPVFLLICFYPQQHGFVLGRRLRRCAEPATDRATRRRSIQLRRNGITCSWPAMRAFFCSFCVPVTDCVQWSFELFCEQIFAYCVCVLASGAMLHRWRSLGTEDRRRVWKLYGWFSGLMLCGSLAGIGSWTSWMQFIIGFMTYDHDKTISTSQKYLVYSISLTPRATFVVS